MHANRYPAHLTHPELRARRERSDRPVVEPRSGQNGCSTKSEVASVRTDSIRSMSREELLDVIIAGKLPALSEETLARLEQADRRTLEQIARTARRVCRRQGY